MPSPRFTTAHNERLLVVDDDREILALLRGHFERQGFRVETTDSLAGMKKACAQYSFDAVLLDMMLGTEDGLDGMPWILKESPFTKVIVLTANTTVERAVEAMKRGASGFVLKSRGPAGITEELVAALERRDPAASSHSPVTDSRFGIIGTSPQIKHLVATIEKIRDIESTVLISGESGTGKELVARALHCTSKRGGHRFEALNCAAIPENLLEAELFGYKRGAFTDAKTDRQGLFEICRDGTLFLDEIGEMPMSLQAKLLRVLQEREVRPLGSAHAVKFNTRCIVATNRDLQTEVREKRFRDDLYFRLSAFRIEMPPLRTHRGDIPPLVEHFLHQCNTQYGREVRPPNAAILARLTAHDWPGNVRELQNTVERGVVLAQSDELDIADLFPSYTRSDRTDGPEVGGQVSSGAQGATVATSGFAGFDLPLVEAKESFERAYLDHLLRETAGNITEAARLAGQYRPNLYRLIAKHNLDTSTYKVRPGRNSNDLHKLAQPEPSP